MTCEFKDQCPIPGDRGVKRIFQRKYCEGNWHECARYNLSLSSQLEKIPLWLLPNMEKEASELLINAT